MLLTRRKDVLLMLVKTALLAFAKTRINSVNITIYRVSECSACADVHLVCSI